MNINLGKIAVAISIYKNDNLDYFKLAIESILNQSYDYFDIYIQVDGYVNEDLKDYLLSLSNVENIFVYFNSDNKGLATRLNQIIDLVYKKDSYRFIARMDADDISALDRFASQVDYLNHNVSVSVVGSDVIEIDSEGREIFYKKMPIEQSVILKNIIKRCPLNHPSVMFNLSHFTKNELKYDSRLKNTQDYYLWVDLLSLGKVFSNINRPLLMFRVDDNFHSRRGLSKAFNDLKSRIYAFKKLKNINVSNLIHVILLFMLRVSPVFVKKFIYGTFR
ncbi:glycosyltransferase [Vibrio furnissii]|uniref:glycosyltransferase n=1 Tax=Vibrio furnissii TaxID=29494 RepID=UPI000200D18E|nr:glycosyltransferase [Vibrio furnissii]ADT85356.1 glycosyltransferase [Vibrio furnissii NCTC 11218]